MKIMTINERLHAPSYDIRLLAHNAMQSSCLVWAADLYATTSEWLMECRAERIAYQTLADYAF